MANEGIIRYGFHGLSYESLVRQLGRNVPSRTVAAHLGNGASLAALRNGISIDTSMGLTPTGGVVMGTRSGDLDPGILLHLMRARHLGSDELEKLLNHRSGLAGISGGTSDMRSLEAAAAHGEIDAQLAIEMFAYSISKAVGAYAAALGGVDMLVFTGGIGEHSSALRDRVCSSLQFLGIALDHDSNQRNLRRISTQQSTCAVEIIPSQENQQIAIHVRALNMKRTRS
jgi:acetate kinase